MRAGFGGAYGLDFQSILSFAAAVGADVGFVADLLPRVELVIVSSLRSDEDDVDQEP